MLTPAFHLAKDGDLDLYYSPHNEYINPHAVVAISGITPGFFSNAAGLQKAAQLLKDGETLETIAYETKEAAGLSGSMRQNIIEMLNECGLPAALHVEDSSRLFDSKRELLHTTSVIKHPVFYKQKNYTGHRPAISRSALLSRYALKCFPDEIEMMEKDILLIPLGKAKRISLPHAEEERQNESCGHSGRFPASVRSKRTSFQTISQKQTIVT